VALKNRLRRAVCAGTMKLAEAGRSIITTKMAHGFDLQVRY